MFRNLKPIFLILMGACVIQISKAYALQKEEGSITHSLQHLKNLLENKLILRALTRGKDTSTNTLTDQTNNKQSEDVHAILNALELLCRDASFSTLTAQTNKISADMHAILSELELLCQAVSTMKHNETDGKDDQNGNDQKDNNDQKNDDQLPTSCLDALKNGRTISGVYTVQPGAIGDPVEVYCDQETDGGGWTVFQRRKDGTVNFYQYWHNYKVGFGNLDGEFWLGNDNLHRLLSDKSRNELRVDLGDFDNNKAFAKYSRFMIGSENENYFLTVKGYSGDAGDSLAWHDGQKFSTKDRDNDRSSDSCSQNYKGGWWYNRCYHSNLNGLYSTNIRSWDGKNVIWFRFNGNYPLKFSEMKFREHVQN